jgi:hypothetical protein
MEIFACSTKTTGFILFSIIAITFVCSLLTYWFIKNYRVISAAIVGIIFLVGGMVVANTVLKKNEQKLWTSVKKSDKADMYANYLSSWPNGVYSDLAKKALNEKIDLPFRPEVQFSRNNSFAFSGISEVGHGSLDHAMGTAVPEADFITSGSIRKFKLDTIDINIAKSEFINNIIDTKDCGQLECRLLEISLEHGLKWKCRGTRAQRDALHKLLDGTTSSLKDGMKINIRKNEKDGLNYVWIE